MFCQTNFGFLDENGEEKDSEIIPLTLELITSLSPNEYSMMELRDAKEISILQKCYNAFPSLSQDWLDFRCELHMTSDKDIFEEEFQEGFMPLYEGKMSHQYNAHFAKSQYFLDPQKLQNKLKSKEIHRCKQDLNLNQKEYEKLLAKYSLQEDGFISYDKQYFRLIFRGIAANTNERTLIFSLLPKNTACGNTLFSSIPKYYSFEDKRIVAKEVSHLRLIFTLGIFNSLLLDFIARQMIQISVSKTYIIRLPIPKPSDEEILKTPLYYNIAINALKLQLYKDKAFEDFKDLATEFNISNAELPTTPKAYDILKASTDIKVAKLYGINTQEFYYLLSTFKVLASKNAPYIALLKELAAKELG